MLQTVSYLCRVADVFALLVLAAAGPATIFGMMGIINMAHGEFVAVGAYVTTYSCQGGAPLVLAILLATIVAGKWWIALERTIVRRFCHRPSDSLVATWGSA